jgi:hypothetical protein
MAALVRESDLFDAGGYCAQAGGIGHLDPVVHYLLVGELLGYAPSTRFDPAYYGSVYPDIIETPNNRLIHYIRQGRQEGRKAVSIASSLCFDHSRVDASRETIIVVGDTIGTSSSLANDLTIEFSKRYNLIRVCIAGEALEPRFRACSAAIIDPPSAQTRWHPLDFECLVRRILKAYKISFALVIGIESQVILKSLSFAFVPTVTVVSELPPHFLEKRMEGGLEWSTKIVFVNNALAATAQSELSYLRGRQVHILEQETSNSSAGQTRPGFDLNYCMELLETLGRTAMAMMLERENETKTILEDPAFETTSFVGNDLEIGREEAVRAFVARAAAVGIGKAPEGNFGYRRPCAGFHPQIYAFANRDRGGTAANPLAQFIRSGKPDGIWCNELITPGLSQGQIDGSLRIAIHYHCFYPELCEDFLLRLTANRSRCDLLISTDEEQKAKFLRRKLERHNHGCVVISVVPNCGRDIGPFLTAFQTTITKYDVVGHLHGKRSSRRLSDSVAENWCEFLFQHLLGDLHPMMDIISQHFINDERLGLVFAEDPHLPEWDANKHIADKLSAQMGLDRPLPPFFEFPIGNMFWARPQALRPLFELNLGWGDYPQEPILHDGTLLHAIERLLPFVVRHTGYRCAMTHIPGMIW